MRRWLVRALVVLLAAPAVTVVAATAGAQGAAPGSRAAADGANAPTTTPIHHFVALMQSSHSFDNYFGTYAGADGIPADVCMPVNNRGANRSGCVRPFHLDNQPPEDLDHDLGTQRGQYNRGRMDGFVGVYRSGGRDGSTAMGYYDRTDLPYYWGLADQNVLFDRFFSSAIAGSRLNHFYWVAGAPTPGGGAQLPPGGYGSIPTIFDELQARGISWKFYVEGYDPNSNVAHSNANPQDRQLLKVPLLDYPRYVNDPRLFGRIVDISQYQKDLVQGSLPEVSYVVSLRSSENPPSRLQAGESFVQRLVSGLMQSRYWPSSAFMMTYDGWGGWYDHVSPPKVDDYGYGFRVPALLVSPYARPGYVDHTQLDYTSALKFIEDNWRLPPLAARDAQSAGLGTAFDFSQSPRQARLVTLASTGPTSATGSGGAGVVYALYGPALVLVTALAVWTVRAISRRRRELGAVSGAVARGVGAGQRSSGEGKPI